jgi:transposase
MQYLHGQIQQSDKLMERIACDLEQCKRLMAIPGIGPTIATATIAGDPTVRYENRRSVQQLSTSVSNSGPNNSRSAERIFQHVRFLCLEDHSDSVWL